MKFGGHIKDHLCPEWAEYYLEYDTLKNIIKDMEALEFGSLPDGS